MIAGIFLILAGFALWILFFIIQFAALLSLLALALGLVMMTAVYGANFLGFYYLFGEANTGWAIFAAMFSGTAILSIIAKSAKQLLNQERAVSRDLTHQPKNNGRSEKLRILGYEKDHPIYSKYPEFETRNSVLIIERYGKRTKYSCFACKACGFRFTRIIPAGLFCPFCASLNVGRDPRIRI